MGSFMRKSFIFPGGDTWGHGSFISDGKFLFFRAFAEFTHTKIPVTERWHKKINKNIKNTWKQQISKCCYGFKKRKSKHYTYN